MRSRPVKSKEINGYTYTVTMLGAKDARDVAMRLAKADGNMLKLSWDDFEYIVDKFAKHTDVFGDGYQAPGPNLKMVMDDHFAGHFADQMGWLNFCVEENFQNATP